MGASPTSELVERVDRTCPELLEHEQLGTAETEFPLGTSRRMADRADNATERVNRSRHLIVTGCGMG
ncbi:MAG TPA: hypothetical protein VFJ81_00925 [Gemmatimonadales bacterium]|nr:hypothetical protein [Gemmatimonadales bacterium]